MVHSDEKIMKKCRGYTVCKFKKFPPGNLFYLCFAMHAIQGISSTFFHYFFGRVCHCTRGFSTWDPEGAEWTTLLQGKKVCFRPYDEKKVEPKWLRHWSCFRMRNSAPPVALFRWHCFPKRPQGGPILAPLIFSVRQCWSILMDIVMQKADHHKNTVPLLVKLIPYLNAH